MLHRLAPVGSLMANYFDPLPPLLFLFIKEASFLLANWPPLFCSLPPHPISKSLPFRPKMSFLLPLLLFIISMGDPAHAFRLQGVGVKGTLLCKGSYSVHTNVAIFDVDRNPGDPDDLLDKSYTDRNGRFVLDGTTRELTTIEPELRIIHDCDDGIKPCHRLMVIKVPVEYIHHGKVDQFFDIGVLDLAEKGGENEQRTCHEDFD